MIVSTLALALGPLRRLAFEGIVDWRARTDVSNRSVRTASNLFIIL